MSLNISDIVSSHSDSFRWLQYRCLHFDCTIDLLPPITVTSFSLALTKYPRRWFNCTLTPVFKHRLFLMARWSKHGWCNATKYVRPVACIGNEISTENSLKHLFVWNDRIRIISPTRHKIDSNSTFVKWFGTRSKILAPTRLRFFCRNCQFCVSILMAKTVLASLEEMRRMRQHLLPQPRCKSHDIVFWHVVRGLALSSRTTLVFQLIYRFRTLSKKVILPMLDRSTIEIRIGHYIDVLTHIYALQCMHVKNFTVYKLVHIKRDYYGESVKTARSRLIKWWSQVFLRADYKCASCAWKFLPYYMSSWKMMNL